MYRLGSHIPAPYVDFAAIRTLRNSANSGVVGFLDLFSGGALTNVSVAYFQQDPNFIADKVFPTVSVGYQTNQYFVWSIDDFYRDDAQKRAERDSEWMGRWLGNAGTDIYKAKTPDEVVSRLDKELRAVLAEPDTIAKMAATGAEPPATPGPDGMRTLLAEDTARWKDILSEGKIKLQ